jgi:hypothetical protein
MMKFLIFLLLIFFQSYSYAGTHFSLEKAFDGEEFFTCGKAVLVTKKKNNVLLYSEQNITKNRKAELLVGVTNLTENHFNVYISNIKIFDQAGRAIDVIDKSECMAKINSRKNWALFFSGLAGAASSVEAQKAGDVTYSQYSSTNSWNKNSNTYTTGTIHSEGLRQEALRNSHAKTNIRNQAIQDHANILLNSTEVSYFDTTTIFPGKTYFANFQIRMSSQVEKELEFILVHITVEDELFEFKIGVQKSVRRKMCI